MHIPLLLLFQSGDAAEHIREADDAIERRSQFVAHGCQEVALEPIHLVEVHIGLGQLVDLGIEITVDLEQLVLRVNEPSQHAIEGCAEILKLIAGVNLGAGSHVAFANLVTDFPQMLQRLDDHIADNRVGREHRQEDGDDSRRQQNCPIPVDGVLRCGVRDHHSHHGHELVLRQPRAGRADRVGGAAVFVADQAARAGADRLVVVILGVVGGAKLTILCGIGRQHRRARTRLRQHATVGVGVSEVVEDRRVERGVALQFIAGCVGPKDLPSVGLALQLLAERLDERGVFLVCFEGLPVVVQHHRVDEMAAGRSRAGEDEIFSAAAVPPKAPCDQQQQAEPEEEAALPLQAGFAQDFLK